MGALGAILPTLCGLIGNLCFFFNLSDQIDDKNTQKAATDYSEGLKPPAYRAALDSSTHFILGCVETPLIITYLDFMNRIASLRQIKHYQAKPLSAPTHAALAATLRCFTPDPALTRLSYTHSFAAQELAFLHEKMTQIGTIADEIDHHPEWTLKEGRLEIGLSTHDIGNRISLKDYFLATWIEQVLTGGELEQAVLRGWNAKGINLDELR